MNNQVMTRDDHSEQQNLKINVNVILNVFLFVLQSENKFCTMN